MPFYYDVNVPNIQETGDSQGFVFVKFLTSTKAYVKPGTPLAILRRGETRYLLRNAGEGLFTQWKIGFEQEISARQAIGRITTDGELIPYGRPYFTIEVAPPDQL